MQFQDSLLVTMVCNLFLEILILIPSGKVCACARECVGQLVDGSDKISWLIAVTKL